MDVWNEGGKNRWRYHEGSDQNVIEIELTQGKVALIDAERLGEVQQYSWHLLKASSSKHIMYAVTEIPKKLRIKTKTVLMHVLLYPDIKAPRDHIDHNGLNNVSANIRSGANGINERNVITKNRTAGVKESPHLKQYAAAWTETNGQTISKLFSWSKYPSKEAAYEAAVLCRKTNTERVIKEIEAINASDSKQMPERYVKKPKVSNSGIKHIGIRNIQKHQTVVVQYTTNKKRYHKTFPVRKYENNLNLTLQIAKEWLEKIKTDNPRKRKIDDE